MLTNSIKNKKIKIWLFNVLGVAIFVLNIIVSNNAYAEYVKPDQLMKLALSQGVEDCYWDVTVNEAGDSKITLNDFNEKGEHPFNYEPGGEVVLPTMVGNSVKDSKVNCMHAVYFGDGDAGSFLKNGGHGYYSKPGKITEFGYEFKPNTTEVIESNKVEVTISSVEYDDPDEEDTVDTSIVKSEGTLKITGSPNGSEWTIQAEGYLALNINNETWVKYTANGSSISHWSKNGEADYIPCTGDAFMHILTLDANGNYSDFKKHIEDAVESCIVEQVRVTTVHYYYDILSQYLESDNITVNYHVTNPTISSSNEPDDLNAIYEHRDGTTRAARILLYNVLHGDDSIPVIELIETTGTVTPYQYAYGYWNSNFTYGLYYNYLTTIGADYITIGPCKKDKPSVAYYFRGKKDNWCSISFSDSQILEKDVAIVIDNRLKMRKFKEALEWFKDESSYDHMDEDKYSGDDGEVTKKPKKPTPGPTPGPGEDSELTPEEGCYKEAQSLGWIMCPMIFGLQKVGHDIYEDHIEPLIMVNDTIVEQLGNQKSSIYSGWNAFRSFANFIFVLMFIFIIFSQLTGVGIDNYGIKKMLPKVILTAVLVNLSFLICAVAIDATNVIGNGIEGLFNGLKVSGTAMPGSSGGSGFAAVVADITLFFVLPAGAAVLFAGWAVVIPILLFLLTAVIAIIFALIILGVRQALIILLVVLSPVAIVCSMLPNTDKLYRRWLDTFKGMLLVYPIIGALIGAGYFCARILLTDSHNLLMSIIAGLLCVVPYFMIPSLTKKALSAVGDIGSKIAGLGSGLGRGLKGAINGTDAVHNAKADSQAWKKSLGAKAYMATHKNLGERIKNGEKVSTRAANRYARAASLANANREATLGARSAMSKYNRLSDDNSYKAAISAAEQAEKDTDVKNYETLIQNGDYEGESGKIGQNDAAALAKELEHEVSNGNDEAKIKALTNRLLANGKKGAREFSKAYQNLARGGKDMTALASHVKNNHSELSDLTPSVYEHALKAATGTGDANFDKYNNEGIGSLNASKMARLDKDQLGQYLKRGADGKVMRDADGKIIADFAGYMDSDKQTQFANLAAQALSDDRIKGDISGDNKELLEAIAKAGGVSVSSTGSGESLVIDHSVEAQRDVTFGRYQQMVEQRVNNGNLSREQADRLLNQAKVKMWDKNHGGKP